MRLCRVVLWKGFAFPALGTRWMILRRGCASPVEAQPQPNKKKLVQTPERRSLSARQNGRAADRRRLRNT